MPAGRPTQYTETIAAEICQRLSEGESLRRICRDEHIPAESTVRGWAIDPNHPISAHYTRAREIAYHSMADELLEIADDGSNDWMEREGKDDVGGPSMASMSSDRACALISANGWPASFARKNMATSLSLPGMRIPR